MVYQLIIRMVFSGSTCYSFICLCSQGLGLVCSWTIEPTRFTYFLYLLAVNNVQTLAKHMEFNKQLFCELIPITLFIKKQYMFKTGITLFALIVCVIMNNSFISSAFAASPPVPAFGTATVDGDASEWNLAEDGTGDFFANMYRAGNSEKPMGGKPLCLFQKVHITI